MLATYEIHDRVENAIRVALPEWRPSAHGWVHQPLVPGGAERAHQTFVVHLPTTTINAGRQNYNQPMYVSTALQLRYLYRLRVEQRSIDYRSALLAEETLLTAALEVSRSPELSMQLRGDVRREELSSETGPMLLGNIDFVIHHSLNPGGADGRTV